MSKTFAPDPGSARLSPPAISPGSYFADSAINLDTSTPTRYTRHGFDTPPPLKSLPPLDALYSTTSHLFERLTQLAASAWDAEQDGRLHVSKVENLHRQLDGVETIIQGAGAPPGGEPLAEQPKPSGPNRHSSSASLNPTTSPAEEVLASLTSTVSSLRLRHAEHRHLLQLSVSHLETVSQRCLAQQRTIQTLTSSLHDQNVLKMQHTELLSEANSLRDENQLLGQSNDALTQEIEALQSENTTKDVAMEAISVTVSGLEGWIENAAPSTFPDHTHIPHSAPRLKREVIRGRGRFRGRYYVDGSDDEPQLPDMDVRDLHDGVKAWLRGFRDVEEGLKARGRGKSREVQVKEDEWGDFESTT